MTQVRSEIAANVWQVKVSAGQPVQPGDSLVVLESMKMEIPVECPVAGRVTEVRVEEGAHVEEGDVIAVIDDGQSQ